MSTQRLRRATIDDTRFLTEAILGSGDRNMRYLLGRQDDRLLSRWVRAKVGLFSYRFFWIIEVDGTEVAAASAIDADKAVLHSALTYLGFNPLSKRGRRRCRRFNELSEPLAAIPRNCTQINSVYVQPSYRQQGLASKLIRAIAAQHPFNLSLQVELSNTSAIALYEKLEFKPVAQSTSSVLVPAHQVMVKVR